MPCARGLSRRFGAGVPSGGRLFCSVSGPVRSRDSRPSLDGFSPHVVEVSAKLKVRKGDGKSKEEEGVGGRKCVRACVKDWGGKRMGSGGEVLRIAQ